jgi:hypothetical protein
VGRESKLNPRSTDGGNPPARASFHRCIRACRTFHGDVGTFHAWLDTTSAGPHHRAAMQKIWDELHPTPLVTIETSIPESLRA